MTDAAVTIRRGERLYGPYLATQIQEMLEAGSIVPDDEAWSETAGRWTKLSEIIAVTPSADSPLVNQPTTDLGPQEAADPTKQDRAANILAIVGLVAIALGTLDVALNIKRMAKASSQIQRPPDASNSTRETDEVRESPSSR
jgi:hypothetical protein